jgi:hypothetical protein
MSSKLALLLKKKVSKDERLQKHADGPPAKRQKQVAASQLGAKLQQQQGRQKQQHKSAVQRGSAARQTAANGQGFAGDDEDDLEQPAGAEAYSELVGLLSSQRTALGAALKQRQLQEQQGASEEEESESDDEQDGMQVSIAEACSWQHCYMVVLGRPAAGIGVQFRAKAQQAARGTQSKRLHAMRISITTVYVPC